MYRPRRRQGPRRIPRRARTHPRGVRDHLSSAADRLTERLPDAGIDVLLVTNLVNVRYLTGYTGSNGIALVGAATRT
ncbi:MAG TPA: aminopeptidase P family N-terminal domain-containing protein, partial [Solirubrobacteraceae bacterium]|nr:aminopeptidase P family N-terminal domain-containing protein [Solirubrobacteraceae bacterium]